VTHGLGLGDEDVGGDVPTGAVTPPEEGLEAEQPPVVQVDGRLEYQFRVAFEPGEDEGTGRDQFWAVSTQIGHLRDIGSNRHVLSRKFEVSREPTPVVGEKVVKMTPRDDERLTMALRPVSDPAEQDATGNAGPSELDGVAELISSESHPDGTPTAGSPQFTMIERSRPAQQAPKHTVAGWYPDESDPTLMRYWDGFHLTGQTMRVDPAPTDEAEEAATPVPSRRVDADEPSSGPHQTWTVLPADVGDSPESKKVAAQEATSDAADGVDDPAPGMTADHWVDKAARSVARARTDGTPEAWGEVVSIVGVVSELAQTMVVAAGAAQVSEEAGRVAEKAEEDAEAAVETATTARLASQEAADKAQRAEEAAKAASRAAADAMQAAEQAEQEAPVIAEVAEAAARSAADAKARSKGIEAIVAEALAADTPDAWAAAHRLAAAALES